MWFRPTGNMPGWPHRAADAARFTDELSSERESRKLLRCKEGSYWPVATDYVLIADCCFRSEADIDEF